MSKEIIEEMARSLNEATFGVNVHTLADHLHPETINKVAEYLYNAGYHKQSEGEWIDKPTGAYSRMQSWCSACGKHSGIGGIESNRHKPFCPNCGAKMKGGAE